MNGDVHFRFVFPFYNANIQYRITMQCFFLIVHVLFVFFAALYCYWHWLGTKNNFVRYWHEGPLSQRQRLCQLTAGKRALYFFFLDGIPYVWVDQVRVIAESRSQLVYANVHDLARQFFTLQFTWNFLWYTNVICRERTISQIHLYGIKTTFDLYVIFDRSLRLVQVE